MYHCITEEANEGVKKMRARVRVCMWWQQQFCPSQPITCPSLRCRAVGLCMAAWGCVSLCVALWSCV